MHGVGICQLSHHLGIMAIRGEVIWGDTGHGPGGAKKGLGRCEVACLTQAYVDELAVRLTLPAGTSASTMKNRIQRVATELGIPVTIRRVSGGLLFWRSTDEDLQQA